MSTLNSALRNFETEAFKVAARPILLADGSTTSFQEALMVIADVFGSDTEYRRSSNWQLNAAQNVYQAAMFFWVALHNIDRIKQNENRFEMALRAFRYLNKDLTSLSGEELREETLKTSIRVAHGVYNDSEQSSEDKRRLDDSLNVLKSPDNFQSAIHGVLTELDRSRLIHHAQDAHNKLAPQSARQF